MIAGVNAAALVTGGVAGDGAAVHGEGLGVPHAAAVSSGVAGNATAVHGERALVVYAAALALGGSVAGDGTVPKRKGAIIADAAASLALLVRYLAHSFLAIGDGKVPAFCHRDGILARRPGDDAAVEAKLDVNAGFNPPGIGKRYVACQVVVARLGGQAIAAHPRGPGLVAVALFATAVLAADAVDMLGSQFKAVVAVGDKLIALVIVRKALAVGGAGNDGRARAGLFGRDADARLVGEGHARLDLDSVFASEVDVVRRGAHLVFSDGHIASNGKGAGIVHAATSDIRGVVANASASHGEGSVVAHAAAPVGGVVRNDAAAHGERAVSRVVDGSAVFGRVTGNLAGPQRKRAIVHDGTAACALGVGDLTGLPFLGTRLAVGDGQAGTGLHVDSVIAFSAGNRVAVKAKVHLVLARPNAGAGYVAREVIVTVGIDLVQAGYGKPSKHLPMPLVIAAVLAADAVLVGCQAQVAVARSHNGVQTFVCEEAVGGACVAYAGHYHRAPFVGRKRNADACVRAHLANSRDGLATDKEDVACRAVLVGVARDLHVARNPEFAVVVHSGAAARAGDGVAHDLAAGHREGAAVADAGAVADSLVVLDAAAGHGEGAGVTHACAVARGIVANGAAPQREGAVVSDSATTRALGVGNLTRIFAVGDGEATVVGHNGNLLPVRTGDGVAVKAKLDVRLNQPVFRKGNVGREVVVARLLGKAVVACPQRPLDVVVPLFATIGLSADAVLVNRGNPQAAVTVRLQNVVRVVASESGGVRCPFNEGRVRRGVIAVDADLGAAAHAGIVYVDAGLLDKVNVVRVAVLAGVASNGRSTRDMEPGVVVNAAAEAVESRPVVDVVAGDGAAVHVEQGVVRHARTEAGRIAGDGAAPHREPAGIDANTVAGLAAFMGDLARTLAVGDDELPACDYDGAVAVGAGDGVAVEAKVDGIAGVDVPHGGKRDVFGEVVVRVAGLFAGQAVGLIPRLPLNISVLGVGAAGVAADAVVMGRFVRGKSGLGIGSVRFGHSIYRRIVGLGVNAGLVGVVDGRGLGALTIRRLPVTFGVALAIARTLIRALVRFGINVGRSLVGSQRIARLLGLFGQSRCRHKLRHHT